MVCSFFLDTMVSRFDQGKFGAPSDFNEDLPLQLAENLNDELFVHLLAAKNFGNVKALRDEVGMIIDPILNPWSGKNTSYAKSLLENKIDIAAQAGKDETM